MTATYHSLATVKFEQRWTNTNQITANDDWSGVPSIVGYLGDDTTTTAAPYNIQTQTSATVGTTVDVIANLTATTSTSGGVGEFQIANPTIGLQGSGTADFPHIIIYLDATGRTNITLTAVLRDLDASTDDAVQAVNVQYRTSPTGTWTNVSGGYYPDVTTAGTATQTTAVNLVLPSAADNVATLQIRIMTGNAAAPASLPGSGDEWVGVDDIEVNSQAIVPPAETQTVVFNPVTVSQNEGNSGTTNYVFTVTRTGGTTGILDFSGTVAPDSTDTADFPGGTVPTTFNGSIPAGQASATVTVGIAGDTVIEFDDSFTLTLTSVTNQSGIAASIGTGSNATATGTILNDDTPVLTINSVSQTEGDSGTVTYSFTVSLDRPAPVGGVMFDIATADNTATTANSDYVGKTLTSQTIAQGLTSYSFDVTVNGDTAVENDETFFVNVTNVTNASTNGTQGTGTILNNDSPPTPPGSVSIADASIVEGNAGTSTLMLTLTRTGGTSPFQVNWATSNGGNPNNASATSGSDYVAASGTASFATGINTATVSITINGDTTAELSEEFTVTLSGATNGATISDATAIATITTDDVLTSAVAAVWFNEINYDPPGGDAGEFIEIAGIAGTDLSQYSIVRYNGNGNTAYTSPAQSTAMTGTIPDQGGGYGTFTVFFDPDGLQNGAPDAIALARTVNSVTTLIEFLSYEGTMTGSGGVADGVLSTDIGVIQTQNAFTAQRVGGLGSSWVLQAATQGAFNTGQTLPSGAPAGPTVAVSDVSVNEVAGTMTFTVTRTNVAPGAFSVNYATANGTATAGSDYTVASGTLNFTDNQVTSTVTVAIADEAIPELDETVLLNLSGASGATIADAQGVGTIVNDDGPPIQVAVNDVSVQEGNSGTSIMTFTVTRTGAAGAFSVSYATADGSAVAPGDYVGTSGTLSFLAGENSKTIPVTINGDTLKESNETFQLLLSAPTNNAVLIDGTGVGTIASDDLTFIHDIQGTAYYSPILATDGISSFNTASTTVVTIRAIVTAVDNVGDRQGYYLTEEASDWDSNTRTSEGIFVMTRNDAGAGVVVSGVSVGDLIQISANVMEYQAFSTMPRTVLVNPTGLSIITTGNSLVPITLTLTNIPNEVMTGVTPDYTDSSDGAGDTFDASVYALSYFETVEGMLVTIPDMVVADGFVSTSSGDPYLKAYSLASANADQINSRGGYTIAGDPPAGPPDTATTGDDTHNGGRVLHDGDVNPDIVEIDFTDFAISAPAGLLENATMGDPLGDVTGIVDFDFTDLKLFVTAMEPGGFVNAGMPAQEVTALGGDSRSLTVATFNVENLDPTDGAARFAALANAILNNLKLPDIITIEEMQDNNGGRDSSEPATKGAGDGISATGTDATTSWTMLVNALNQAAAAAGSNAVYQWVDELPTYDAEGGQDNGNIRVGFLYNTTRVQLGDLPADAPIEDRRKYTDRIGDGVRAAGDLIAYSDDMIAGEINTADWSNTRRSLLGEFTFNGNKVFVTANHWPSKGGSGEFWQLNQNLASGQPDNSDWAQRSAVGQDVYAMMNLIQTANSKAGIVAGGDFNDFYFYNPLTTVTGYTLADGTPRVGGARFDNLTLTLAEAERYTYTFDGRSQAIDHIIANGRLSAVASYDVVHLNTGYNERGTGANASPALSDHDPAVASFNMRSLDEYLVGTSGPDTIEGFGGDDRLQGLAGADTLDGGDGSDTADFSETAPLGVIVNLDPNVTIAAGPGTSHPNAPRGVNGNEALDGFDNYDTLISIENVITGEKNDIVRGSAGPNRIETRGGNDSLVGLGGDDIMIGGAGDDSYGVDEAGDQVVENPGEGTDTVITTLATYVLPANVENLQPSGPVQIHDFRGNAANNVIEGGSVRDIIRVQDGGDDTVITGNGNDTIYFGAAFTAGDTVDSGAGADAIILQGNYSAGVTFGTGTVSNISGVESISLAPGDIPDYGDTSGASYSYKLTTIDSNVPAGFTLRINGFHLRATENLTFDGSAETNGRFVIFASRGVDTLTGGNGNDFFIVGHDGHFGPSDTMNGGPGYDSLYLRGDYSLDFTAGNLPKLYNFESITLGWGSDTQFIIGGDGEFDYNIVWEDSMVLNDTRMTINGSGLAANETLVFDGSDESDSRFNIFGGAADDTLRGGSWQNDNIYGGEGNDVISSGGGGDNLFGEAGNDRFQFRTLADGPTTITTRIEDFRIGDLMDVSLIDANSNTVGDDAFTLIGSAAFNHTPGELRVFSASGSLYGVEGDVNGDGVADFAFRVLSIDNHILTSADFIL